IYVIYFFFSSRRRHTRSKRDWSSDVCSSDLDSFEVFTQGGVKMKKIEGQMADVIKEIISEGDSVVEIEGRKYYLTLTEKPETTVAEDVEADPELKQKLLQAKMDIFNGKTYTTDEVGEMIDQGEL